jgi:signal transduction histidine kinase
VQAAWVTQRSATIAAVGLGVMAGTTAGGIALSRANGNLVTEDQALLVAFMSLPLVGFLLVWRRPTNGVGWLLATTGVLAGLYLLLHGWAVYGLRTEPGSLPLGGAAAWIATWLLVPAIGLLPFVAATFPTGRIEGRLLRVLGRAALVALGVLAAAQAFAPDDLDGVPGGVPPIPNPLGIEALRGAVSAVSGAAVFVVVAFTAATVINLASRFRRATGDERQQLRWVAAAAAVIPVTLAIAIYLPIPGSEAVLIGGQVTGLVGTAAAIGVAILKYRLYDLGDFLRRAAAYVGLSAAVFAAVVVVAVLVGVLLPGTGEVPAVIATAVVTVALGPLRARLQHAVERRLLGRRSEPFTGLTEIGARLDDSVALETTLGVIAEATATALRLPYIAIELDATGAARHTVHHGSPPARTSSIPLVHRHEGFGEILIGHRSTDEDLTNDEWQLLGDVARQAAMVVHAMTVTDALQHARQHLVSSREEERRRLRRDLHDGIGPTLAGSMLQLDALTDLIDTNPSDAIELADKLKHQLRLVVDDIRRVTHDLRPPALDELGLLAALRAQATTITSAVDTLNVTLALPDEVGSLPAAVEVGVYRIASEALTNVVRHATATHCTLELVADNDRVDLRVTDDGAGMPDESTIGVGLVSMRERASELGGTLTIEPMRPSGTSVHAHLPVNR